MFDLIMKKYFECLDENMLKCHDIARKARSLGYDYDEEVSIPFAKNLVERVEGLVSVVAPQVKNSGIRERIYELECKYSMQDWRVAMVIALEVAQEKFCRFKSRIEAIEIGVRVGFAYVTVGVVSSPLEGFVRLELKKRRDGKEYFCAYFSGPIRSAGGTGASVAVLIIDYIRKFMGYDVYDPDDLEIRRVFSEIEHYHTRITNLQYFPSEKEISFLAVHLPIQIDGDPSEVLEVPNYKDLPRIGSNRLRNGFCLVFAECLSSKAKNIYGRMSKWMLEMGMEHWIFLKEFLDIQREERARLVGKKVDEDKVDFNIAPDFTYIKDVVAGRPVLGYPLRKGGWRLRYGRARTSGFSGTAVHPASMVVLDGFIAIGTQLKVERPGKGTTLSTCDIIEGPIVKLKSGEVRFLDTYEMALEYKDSVDEILFLGDILINYGDFLDRAHVLLPPGYCEEWWIKELEEKLVDKGLIFKFKNCKISFDDAFFISNEYNIPLHPRFTFHWKDVTGGDVFEVLTWINSSVIKEDRIILDFNLKNKRIFELIGLPHKCVMNEHVVVEDDWSKALRVSLGCYNKDLVMLNIGDEKDGLEYVNKLSEVRLRDKSGIFVGTRMGRPEKAKMRKMTGSPYCLFHVGSEGGRLRSFQSCLNNGNIRAQFPLFFCEKCGKNTIYSRCHRCDSLARKRWRCDLCGFLDIKCEKAGHKCNSFDIFNLDIREYYDVALRRLGIGSGPNLVKGVRGTSNKEHIPENLIKGILRAKYNLYVNKDGTIRYDMTEMALTHFKPLEVGVSVDRLKELGYDMDIYGNNLIRDDQILELMCQDIVMPACFDSLEEGSDGLFFRIGNFLDDLLEKFYGLPRFYNFRDKDDVVGSLVLAMSPHTSAGIVARIIGFSKTQGMLAHPLLHSIMRRDVDGDEAGVMLLLDALLNFSRKLLGEHKGATQDEPLVLTSTLIPTEVDDMVFHMDTVWDYPLDFYKCCDEYKYASDIRLETVNDRLNKPEQYLGYGFTHDTNNFNIGVLCSRYKTIPSMMEKVNGQMNIAKKLRAVDQDDVARLVIERHFMRDIKGNLRKFSMQEFRCVVCNEKYRRPLLKGVCKCGGKLLFTISEGSVIKYLEPSIRLRNEYKLPHYLCQTLDLTQQMIDMFFGKEKEKQEGLGKFFG